jgi:hypothetical protein
MKIIREEPSVNIAPVLEATRAQCTVAISGVLINSIMNSKLLWQQMHSLLKHKMLQLTLKISLYMGSYMFRSTRTIIMEHTPDLAKVTVFVVLLVKIHR